MLNAGGFNRPSEGESQRIERRSLTLAPMELQPAEIDPRLSGDISNATQTGTPVLWKQRNLITRGTARENGEFIQYLLVDPATNNEFFIVKVPKESENKAA